VSGGGPTRDPSPVTSQLADLWEGVVDELGDEREAVVLRSETLGDRRLTHTELEARANRLAHHLQACGVGPGSTIGCHLHNSTEYIEAMLAAYKLRAVPINLNHRYVAEELRYHFEDAEPVVVITEPDLAERVEEAGPPPHVLVRGDDYEAALAAASPERILVPDRSDDDLYLLYTGGTTGMPKGVMWRQEDLFFGVIGGAGVPRRGIPRLDDPADIGLWAREGTGIDRRLPLAPLMHGLAQWTALTTLYTGGTLFLDGDPHFDAARALTVVAEERIQLIQLVGDVLALRLAEELHRHGDRYDLAELKLINSSGAVLSPSVQADLRDLLPGCRVVNRFGASETGPQGRVAHDKGEEAPRLIADGDTAVLDEDFHPVGPGGTGLLARKGAIPLGYWNDPEKTARTFPVVDGVRWSVPGDRARVEEDGSIVVLGRGTVVINSGGEKIFPEEVETTLKAHPAVFDAVVVGVPDETYGQRVAAVVQLREGAAEPSLEDLQAHAREHIAGYKVPRQVTVVTAVQRTAVGKADYVWAKEIAGD
jgi:acyl-CoA synthetase (AMP-forming)/AMP-acid ligase II